MILNECQLDMLRNSISKSLKKNGVQGLTEKKVQEALDEFEWEIERVKELSEKLGVKENVLIKWVIRGIDLRDYEIWQIVLDMKQERDFKEANKVSNEYLDTAAEFAAFINDEDPDYEK